MENLIYENFSILVFLHIVSAVIWVGGMIALRFALHPALQNIQTPHDRLLLIIKTLEGFFRIIKVFIWILLFSGVAIVYVKYDFANTLLHIKEMIWIVMAGVFAIAVFKHKMARRAFLKNDFEGAKYHLEPISKKLIPANIIFGLFATLVGVVIRGF